MELIAVFAPLLGAIGAGFGQRFFSRMGAQILTCVFMSAASIASLILFYEVVIHNNPHTVLLAPWFYSDSLQVDWAIRLDVLTLVMMVTVNVVSTLVHIYSIGYMATDPARHRFNSFLSLFTFFMLMLITADNFVQMFFGWEGVGLASYLLIGFWYERESANAAAMKAFLVNRIGDIGFALGIFTVFKLFGSVQFGPIFDRVSSLESIQLNFLGTEVHGLTLACVLLFIGAMGKSAQLGLHVWLPDAMEGPTPVSALIHAATMVTAGVFMIIKLSPLFEYAPFARDLVVIVGATTALFAATIAVTQTDIKRVIAYSTCSQLGYMFFAAGLSAYTAALFHLVTHAFFKALLFLGAGSVIHALAHEQDLSKMGGVWRLLPATYSVMWIGSLALAGIPFFAGYYSKDLILEIAATTHNPVALYALICGLSAALLTAFYSWRLLLLAFHGNPRISPEILSHVHEAPLTMMVPLLILAFGAVFAGYIGYNFFASDPLPAIWNSAIFVLPAHKPLEQVHHISNWLKVLPFVCALCGIGVAYFMYGNLRQQWPDKIVKIIQPLYQLSFHKWYVDELYETCFVKPNRWYAQILAHFDSAILDRWGPNGIAGAVYNSSLSVSRWQTGYLYHYAFSIFIAIALLLGWVLVAGIS